MRRRRGPPVTSIGDHRPPPHDVVVLPANPVTITIPAGRAAATKTLRSECATPTQHTPAATLLFVIPRERACQGSQRVEGNAALQYIGVALPLRAARATGRNRVS